MALVAELDAGVPEPERGARRDARRRRVVVGDDGRHVVCEDPRRVVDRAGRERRPVERDRGRREGGAGGVGEGECDEEDGEAHGELTRMYCVVCGGLLTLECGG